MALTKIQRNMIADSAVMPNNLVTTASYTVGALRSVGAVTGTNFTANGSISATGNLSLSDTITATGGSGLKIANLRSSTSSYAIYYNNSTNEITYGVAPSGGGGVAYDQSLNTTDAVKFAQVTATTSLSVGGTTITNTGTVRLTGVTKSSQSFLLMHNPSTGAVTYFDSPGQSLATTSSVTFANVAVANNITAANITATTSLKIGPNVFPTAYGSNGNFLTTDGFGALSWTNQLKDVGLQGQTTFLPYTINTPARALFKNINNVTEGAIDWAESGFTATGITISGYGSKLQLNGPGFQNLNLGDTGIVLQSKPDVYTARLDFPDGDDNIKLTNGSYNWKFKNDGALQFPDGTTQTTAAGASYNQSLNTTNDVTFKSVTVTSGSGVDYSGGVRSTGDLYLFGGPLGWNGPIRMFGSKVEAACSILPATSVNVNLGSPTQRWTRGWIKTLTVGTNTIYFEDEDNLNTSTFSISTGTVYLDGAVVLDQSVAAGSSPTFATVAVTTSTVENITVASAFVANSSTVQIYDYTMPTAAATTSGWAMTSNGSGAIEFQPAVLSTNITIDGGFANSVYTSFDYAIDGGGASA